MSLKKNRKTVVLGTGGTIAGVRADSSNPDFYESGRLRVTDLANFSEEEHHHIECLDVAQIDSKNMGLPVWQALVKAVVNAFSREDVGSVVITHGTDTLEETAYLLQSLGPWPGPVVMTCAMRPADHPHADGPANLRDALSWGMKAPSDGVYVVFNQQAHHALSVQKISTDPLRAFSSGFAPLAAEKIDGEWVWQSGPPAVTRIDMPTTTHFLGATQWPRVEWLTHHAGCGSEVIDVLLGSQGNSVNPLRGLVIAGTGAGSFNGKWNASLKAASDQGLAIWISSRCAWGKSQPQANQSAGELVELPPAKACMAMALSLMAQDAK